MGRDTNNVIINGSALVTPSNAKQSAKPVSASVADKSVSSASNPDIAVTHVGSVDSKSAAHSVTLNTTPSGSQALQVPSRDRKKPSASSRQRAQTVGNRTDASNKARIAYENRFLALLGDEIATPSAQPGLHALAVFRQRSATISFSGAPKNEAHHTSLSQNPLSISVTLSSTSLSASPLASSESIPAKTTDKQNKPSLKEKYLGFLKFSHSRSKEKMAGVHTSHGSSNGSISIGPSASSTILSNVAEEGAFATPDDIPDPLDLLDRVTRLNSCQWKSPVITDEFYLMEILFRSDQKKALQVLRGLSGLSISSEIANSGATIATSRYSSTNSRLSLADRHSSTSTQESLASSLSPPKSPMLSNKAVDLPASASQSKNPSLYSLENGEDVEDEEAPQQDARTESQSDLVNAPKLSKRPTPVTLLTRSPKSISRPFVKFNSCSTLLTLDGTLFKPPSNPKVLDVTLKSVARAIKAHLNRTYILFNELLEYDQSSRTSNFSQRVFATSDALSEKLFPVWKVRFIPDEVIRNPEIMQAPSLDEIYQFMKQIFLAADLTSEIAIIALIYLERLMYRTKIALSGINCFRAVLGAVMVASKVWDDQAVWNVDFKTIMPDLNLRDLNRLERWWLYKMHFDVSVKRTVFAKYWFEIREMAERVWGVKLNQDQMDSESTELASPDSSDSTNEIEDPKLNLYMPSLLNQQENQRRKSKSDITVIRMPKPLTEDQLEKMSASTTQSRMRESFSISLSSSLNATDADKSVTLTDKGGRSSNNKKPALKPKSSTLKGTSGVKSAATVLSNPKSRVQNLQWGGSNLRRAKSDQLYTPSVPAASVL